MLKRFFIASFIFVILIQTVPAVQVLAEGPKIPCNSYILLDLDNGRVLAEQDADKKIYPASTTKIMTAILALELNPLNKLMTASRAAVIEIGIGGQNIGIQEGEQLYFKDLLNAVLLNSANEGANIIAENSGMTRNEFIKKMNEKAKKIGATHTHFVNTHGMPDPNHYTTARDLGIIARYAMLLSPASNTFRKIVAKKDYTLPPTNKHTVWYGLKVTNKLPNYKSEYFQKVLGVKTGYTRISGNNFVGCVENYEGKRLLSVVAGIFSAVPTSDKFYFTRKLMEYGYKENSTRQVSHQGEFAGFLPVLNQPGGIDKVNLVVSKDVSAFLPNTNSDLNRRVMDAAQNLKAPIKAGTKVAVLKYYLDGRQISWVPLLTEKDIPLSFDSIRNMIILIFSGLIAVFVLLAYIINRRGAKKDEYKTSKPVRRY